MSHFKSMMSLQAVKPMLQDKTKQKVQILKDNGRDELLEVTSLPYLQFRCFNFWNPQFLSHE